MKKKVKASCMRNFHMEEIMHTLVPMTQLEAALAYDKRGRELKSPEERLGFPTFFSERNPPAATEQMHRLVVCMLMYLRAA